MLNFEHLETDHRVLILDVAISTASPLWLILISTQQRPIIFLLKLQIAANVGCLLAFDIFHFFSVQVPDSNCEVIWGGCTAEGYSNRYQNVETKIKAPTSSMCHKYVYTSFMVKLNFKFGSFRSFEFVWVKDNARARNLSNLYIHYLRFGHCVSVTVLMCYFSSPDSFWHFFLFDMTFFGCISFFRTNLWNQRVNREKHKFERKTKHKKESRATQEVDSKKIQKWPDVLRNKTMTCHNSTLGLVRQKNLHRFPSQS